ncbi:hypothetical protein KXD40_008816 [Peronospora effusa]|nr:hypothetical protein KXD40_008816 [Peronospora effusa]
MESDTDDHSDVAACTIALQGPLALNQSIDDTTNSTFSISSSPVQSPLHSMHEPHLNTIVDISSVESTLSIKSALPTPNRPFKHQTITKRVSIEHPEIGLSPDEETQSTSQHSVDSAVKLRGHRTRTDHSKTSTQSSFAVRDSVLSRVSSNVGGLRESFFGVIGRGPLVNDPLELSSDQEFNLDVINESGGMGNTIGEILKPQVNFRNWSTEGYTVLGIGLVLLLLMFGLTELTDSLNGYTIDPGLVFGSLVTLILCFGVFVTYHGVQSFQTHPNPLIYYKCIVDICLALRFLLDPLLLELGVYRANDEASCAYLSGITQFLYLSSDSWYFALIFDLYWSLTNPFMSVKANRRRCKILVYSAGVFTGILAAFVPSIRGFADGNYCWTKRKTMDDPVQRNFFHLNKGSWLLFYTWMILFYISGIAVLTFGVKRLRSGLRDTLQSRREMLRNGTLSITSYTIYWTVVFIWYAASFQTRTTYDKNGHISPSHVFRGFSFTLTARGAVDYFVWFMINKPSLIRANWLKFTSDSADKQFSAQLNTALQEELIYFTIEGMTRAVKTAEEDLIRIRERSPTQELMLGASDSDDDGKSTQSLAEAATTATGPIGSESSSNLFRNGPGNRMLYTIQEVINAGLRRNSSADAETRAVKKKNSKEGDFSFDIPADQHSIQQPCNVNRRTSSPSSASTAATSVDPRLQFPVADTTTASIRFTPYKPQAFAELRQAYGIKAVDFMKSFQTSTKPNISEGASGAFMFFSGDKKYIVKSMAEEEARFLCEIAEKYVEYLTLKPSSLITKFYGCFKITMYDKRFYFIVMENLFDAMEEGVQIHHRFDIKGSWVNRSYKRPRLGAKVKCRHCSMMFKYGAKKRLLQCSNVVGLHEPNVVLKDNDLRTRMRIGTKEGVELYEQLRDDSLFLCKHGIMDYSLLLGVMDIEFAVDQPPIKSTFSQYTAANPMTNRATNLSTTSVTTDSLVSSTNRSLKSSTSDFSSHPDDDNESMANGFNPLGTTSIAPSVHSLFQELPSTLNQSRDFFSTEAPRRKRAMRKSQRVFGPGYYYVGIIDILQTWTLQKKLERFWKVKINQKDGEGLSAIDPVRYQRRFEAKLREIIAIPTEFYHFEPRNVRKKALIFESMQRLSLVLQATAAFERAAAAQNVRRKLARGRGHSTETTGSLNPMDDGDSFEQTGRNPQPILLPFNQRLITKTSRLSLTDFTG